MAGDNPLAVSWRDSAWIPILNPSNVMDYFSERSNLFYDKNCNNELIKMQRLGQEQLNNMTGVEYLLLHVHDPILYVIRKQHRLSPQQATPLADYYIIGGTVYQAPDLCSVINSRMLNCIHSLQSAFEEAQSFSRYHPSRGYWWAFKDSDSSGADKEKKKRRKEEPSSYFQRQRVDVLLGELAKKFPPKVMTQPPVEKPKEEPVVVKQEIKPEVKVERPDDPARPPPPPPTVSPAAAPHKPPPEKKPKLIR